MADDDLSTIFYITIGIIAAILIVLIILVSYLYYWVNKISSSVKSANQSRNISNDYRISRARIQPDPYKRFNLPQKSDDVGNSDIFFGTESPKVENRLRDTFEPANIRNPLGQNPHLVEELKYSKSFRGPSRMENPNYQTQENQPTHDYYANERNRFAY